MNEFIPTISSNGLGYSFKKFLSVMSLLPALQRKENHCRLPKNRLFQQDHQVSNQFQSEDSMPEKINTIMYYNSITNEAKQQVV